MSLYGPKQTLSLKLQQKLSPQQIQLMKLLQIPTASLEQRIQEELEIMMLIITPASSKPKAVRLPTMILALRPKAPMISAIVYSMM
jgi:Sigma-54 factor, Activator interacting domain (AID)